MCGFSSLLHPVASASPALWPVSQRAGLHECRLQSGFRPRAAWSRLVFLHALILFLFTAIGPMFSSDIAADGPQLSILSANVTSMRKNFAIIRGIDSSYSLLQETTLNIHGQSSMRKVLHRTGYDALLGPPCGFKLSGSQFQHTVWNSKSGGLATVARQPLPCKSIVSTSPVFTSGKCTLTWIPTGIGARGLYAWRFNCNTYFGPALV